DRRKIRDRIVAQLAIEAAVRGNGTGIEQNSVSVGVGPCHVFGAEIVAGAGPVLDEHLLGPHRRKPVCEHARDNIRRTPRGDRDNDAHGFGWVHGLRRLRDCLPDQTAECKLCSQQGNQVAAGEHARNSRWSHIGIKTSPFAQCKSNLQSTAAWEGAMQRSRRHFLHLAAGAVALPAVARMARAQAYPTPPARLISGFPAGGINDLLARLIGQRLSERLGQQFVVENRPGAAGNIATEAAVRAPPDGYTLLMLTVTHAINATLYDKLNYDLVRDVAPVA